MKFMNKRNMSVNVVKTVNQRKTKLKKKETGKMKEHRTL